MGKIKRLPYRLARMIWGSELCKLLIANPETSDYFLEERFPLGLPIDIVNFIKTHCRCTYCKATIAESFNHCSCGQPKDKRWHLEVEYPTELYYTIINKILYREQSRIKSMWRREMIADNGGTVSKEEIAELYQIQQGICYYCGIEISDISKNSRFHIDHYHPISYGGSNDIFNIVLTCPSCNLKKGDEDGDSFERTAKKKRHSDVGRRLGQIRRKRNAYLKRYEV